MYNNYILSIKLDEGLPEQIVEYYKKLQNTSVSNTDSGVDLPIVKNYDIEYGSKESFNFGIKCEMRDSEGNTVPYYLYPRSSISKTPLTLANSVGIIDKDYRGNLQAKIICHKLLENELEDSYRVDIGHRLFQICSRDLSPIQVRLVDSLTETERGEGGFGSTGLSV